MCKIQYNVEYWLQAASYEGGVCVRERETHNKKSDKSDLLTFMIRLIRKEIKS